MNQEIVGTEQMLGIVTGLKIWHNIVPVLAITTIGTRTELCKKVMSQFENYVKDFYEIRDKKLLMKGNIVGGDETFYMHCLRFYFLMNAKCIF